MTVDKAKLREAIRSAALEIRALNEGEDFDGQPDYREIAILEKHLFPVLEEPVSTQERCGGSPGKPKYTPLGALSWHHKNYASHNCWTVGCKPCPGCPDCRVEAIPPAENGYTGRCPHGKVVRGIGHHSRMHERPGDPPTHLDGTPCLPLNAPTQPGEAARKAADRLRTLIGLAEFRTLTEDDRVHAYSEIDALSEQTALLRAENRRLREALQAIVAENDKPEKVFGWGATLVRREFIDKARTALRGE